MDARLALVHNEVRRADGILAVDDELVVVQGHALLRENLERKVRKRLDVWGTNTHRITPRRRGSQSRLVVQHLEALADDDLVQQDRLEWGPRLVGRVVVRPGTR